MTYRTFLLALTCLLPILSFADTATSTAAATRPASTAAQPGRTPRPTITIVNLNTADAATLARDMEGIGATKAQAIVEHRKSKGAFRSVDELALVKGIGSKTLERNRTRLTVGGSATSAAATNGKGAGSGSAAARAGSTPR